jgi:5-methylcytosine-specific restriction endonuclease McrA
MTKREAGNLGSLAARTINEQKYRNRISNYNLNPKKCIRCNATIPYIKRGLKFCTRSCGTSHTNLNRIRTKKLRPKCLNCDNRLKIRSTKYCSLKCMQNYAWKAWILKVEEIGYFEGYTPNQSGSAIRRIKRFYIEKYGHNCMICKTKEWQNKPIPLILDHINGKSDNWNLDNLRIICPNCDALLPTYGGRNKGNGNRIHKVFTK